MSDPKGDRPDTPETPDGPVGEGAEGAEDVTAATPSSDGPDASTESAASAEPTDTAETPAPVPAVAEDPEPSEDPDAAGAPDDVPTDDDGAVQDDAQDTQAPSEEPAADGEAVLHAEPPADTNLPPAESADVVADADDAVQPSQEGPAPVEPAPGPADGTPDDAPVDTGHPDDRTDDRTDDRSDTDGPEAATAAPSGWRRLGAALRPRASRSQVLAGVLCAALGFALVVQVQQSASDQLSSARQEDLVRLLDEVTDRAQQLGDEVSGLEATRDELESGSGQARSALELAEQRAESEGILSGRLPAQGPGVRVTIQDPEGALKASQMFNVLEELRNAGAEVVELNGVRLVTSTWFEDEGTSIVVDGTALSSPYEWTVIGDPETMDRALEIPGGALATVRTAGAEASTALEDEVKITAVAPPQEPEYAQPERERD